MRMTMVAALAGTAMMLLSAGAFAQTGGRGRGPEALDRGAATGPGARARGPQPYEQAGGGTVRWNTPNAQGNFGTPTGPGAGGSP